MSHPFEPTDPGKPAAKLWPPERAPDWQGGGRLWCHVGHHYAPVVWWDGDGNPRGKWKACAQHPPTGYALQEPAAKPEFPPELIQCIPRHIGQPDGTDILRALRAAGFLRTEPNPLIDCDPGDGIPRGCGGVCNACLRLLVETVEGERDAAAAALAALRERIAP